MNQRVEVGVAVLVTILLIGEAAVFVAAGWWARGVWSPEPCYAVVSVESGETDDNNPVLLVDQCSGDTWLYRPRPWISFESCLEVFAQDEDPFSSCLESLDRLDDREEWRPFFIPDDPTP